MTVKELIEQLSAFPPDAIVFTFDAESETLETITGFLENPRDNTIELCTDDPS